MDTYDQCEKAAFCEVLYAVGEWGVPHCLGRENDYLIDIRVNDEPFDGIETEVRYPDETVCDAGFDQ